jgi:hypothetical protein
MVRQINELSCTEGEYLACCNPFGDVLADRLDIRKAILDLEVLDRVLAADGNARDK